MKYTKKERMNIGRQIYEDQINKYEAAGKYGISAQTAREYMRMYRNTNHLPPKTSKPRDYGLAKAKVIPEAAKLDEYQKMSKEDLISALIDARIREERLKLGYEVVEEDDSKKKLITYVKKTAKYSSRFPAPSLSNCFVKGWVFRVAASTIGCIIPGILLNKRIVFWIP